MTLKLARAELSRARPTPWIQASTHPEHAKSDSTALEAVESRGQGNYFLTANTQMTPPCGTLLSIPILLVASAS
jgi:hypothetical protein